MSATEMDENSLLVPSFAWGARGPLGADELRDAADPLALLRDTEGQFALHVERGGTHLLARDRLGVDKLFLALDREGRVHVSNYALDLVRAGHPLRTIQSVPSGHVLEVDPGRRLWKLERCQELVFGEEAELSDAALADHSARIRERLEQTFAKLALLLRGYRVFVTLSGGLDSTTIAVLARRWFGDVTAVTFGIEASGRPAGGDLEYAERVAQTLGLRFAPVLRTREHVLDLIDEALTWGQDWREFNVHCALVNAALAKAIRAEEPSSAPIAVLTGDVMNELMSDYAPVVYRGRELYRLPRLPHARLRRFLVMGLDSGDREVGIFARERIAAVQPYAWCADAYAALPGNLLGGEGVNGESAKGRLVRSVMGDEVPSFVHERPKVRAQAGGVEPGGTLAILVDEGIDEAWLAHRFRTLYGADERDMKGFLRAGMYRFSTTYPE